MHVLRNGRQARALLVALSVHLLTALPAQAAESGSISGSVVTDAGAKARRLCVEVFEASDPAAPVGSTETDEAGVFFVGELSPGTYKVRFSDCRSLGYQEQWHERASSFSQAEPLTVAGGMTVHIDASLPGPGVRIIETDDSTAVTEPTDEDSWEDWEYDVYYVALATKPKAPVTIHLSAGEGIDMEYMKWQTPRFTPEDWFQELVIVRAVADDFQHGERTATLTHTATSDDPAYDGISIIDLTVRIFDDDVPRSPASIRYTGDASAFCGTEVTLAAKLTDASGVPLAGRKLEFIIGNDRLHILLGKRTTNNAGDASMSREIDSYQEQKVFVKFQGDGSHLPLQIEVPFDVLWAHRFEDSQGRGTIWVNYPYSFHWRADLGTEDTGARPDGYGYSGSSAGFPELAGNKLTRIEVQDSEGYELSGEFEMKNERFFDARITTPEGIYALAGLPQ